MKPCAGALQRHLQTLAAGQPVFVSMFLDDLLVAVPHHLAGVACSAAAAALGGGLDGAPGAGLQLAADKTVAWSPSGLRPDTLPADVRWQADGLVFLGSVLSGCAADILHAGLPLVPRPGVAEHWQGVAGACTNLAASLQQVFSHRHEAGQAQGEAVLNSAQLLQLLLRFCVEPKVMYSCGPAHPML